MEALYSKLYDKFTKLKSKKYSELDQLNLDQEEKFKFYMSAADELIGDLVRDKDMLQAQVSDLKQEIVAIRSEKDEEQEKYEKMLIEETQKNKELLEEVERLNRKEFHSTTNDDMVAIRQVSVSPLSSSKTNNSTKRKRRRNSIHGKEVDVDLGQPSQSQHTSPNGAENPIDEENIFCGAFVKANQPKCCRRKLGGSAKGSDSTICMFQELVECLLNMKFSVTTENDDIQITALHASSGYTFNLGWVKNSKGEEELRYSMCSLGTFETVAPQWMRDDILFSKNMCPMFFKRLSAIKV